MTRFCRWVLSIVLLLAGLPCVMTEASVQAVHPGERLTYDISWLNILAGTAVMEVQPDGAIGDTSRRTWPAFTTCLRPLANTRP